MIMNQETPFSVTPTQPPPAPSMQPAPKQRHGCLTALLILMILANSYLTLSYTVNLIGSMNGASSLTWALVPLVFIALFSVICAILVFRWKKFGFWGYSILGVLVMVINLAMGAGAISFISLISPAVLFGVLHIGKENKGWPQLE
jgi:hypothetical protein